MSANGDLNARWRAVAKLFPAWALPFDMFFNAGTYRFMGGDLIQSMRLDWRVKRAFKELDGASSREIEALGALALLNERRCNDAFKAVAVAYVTVPIALAAMVSEAAPDVAREFIVANAQSIAPIVLSFIVTPIVYFLGFWRAKQMAWTIEFYRASELAASTARASL